MAIPLILAGLTLTGVAAHKNATRYYLRADQLRSSSEFPYKSPINNKITSYNPRMYCGDIPSGSLVCCEIYGCLDHTAIWIDRDIIIELNNSGLVRAISAERFLKSRSGNNIYICTNRTGQPIYFEAVAKSAIGSVYNYREYKLLKYNCHTFVQECFTSVLKKGSKPAVYFTELNHFINNQFGEPVYWDKLKM